MGRVDPETYHEARTMAPNWEVRRIEQEWRKGCATEEIEPKKPDRHFVKFCQSWFEKRGRLKSEVAYVKSRARDIIMTDEAI